VIIHNSQKDSTEKLTSDGFDIFRQKHRAELWCPQHAPVRYIFTYGACQHVTCDTYCINQFRYGMKLCMHATLSAREETNPVSAVRLYHLNPETASLTTRVRHNLDCDARQSNKDERTLASHCAVPCSGTVAHCQWCCVDGWLVGSCAIGSASNTVHMWTIIQRSAFQLSSQPFFHLPACLSVSIHPSIQSI
jgi:hypothetical protein